MSVWSLRMEGISIIDWFEINARFCRKTGFNVQYLVGIYEVLFAVKKIERNISYNFQ